MRSVMRTAVGAVLASGLAAGAFASVASAGEPAKQPERKAAKKAAGKVDRVSVAPDGKEGNGFSAGGSLSADGRYTAFTSKATNLVPGDTNGVQDVFVRDLKTGETRRVSVGADGGQADGASSDASISADGRHVVFSSEAGNLAPGDTEGYHVYVRDLDTGVTERLKDDVGDPAFDRSGDPSVSADGRTVAFTVQRSDSQANDQARVYVLDRDSGRLTRASQSPAGDKDVHAGMAPSLSGDGTKVAYQWSETQRTGRDDWSDLYVHDLGTGKRTQIDVAAAGPVADAHAERPVLSADGRYATYHSPASDVVAGDTNGTQNVFIRDLDKGTTKMVSAEEKSWSVFSGKLSGDNSKLVYAAGSQTGNYIRHVYVRDLASGKTELVSATPAGEPTERSATPAGIDRTGATVTFSSDSADLVDGDTYDTTHVYVRRAAG